MPYIGNTIRAADDYRLIDDISSGFNGSATSFALQVAGSAPVPFPKSPQQILVSVNGVIQEPDPTGASGFNLVGTNIVFSSAPTNGHVFFGIIYATADYLNAGGTFPAGSTGAPSITFIGDENTGLYRKGGGSIGFVADATEIANTDSNGITISSGNLILGDSGGTSSDRILLGASSDLSLYHNGTHNYIDTLANKLHIRVANGENAFVANSDGSVELYHDNSKKFETTSAGATVTGSLTATGFTTDGGGVTLNGANYNAAWVRSADTMRFNDNAIAGFGNADDLKIYHNGSVSRIQDAGTGGLQIITNSLSLANAANSESMIVANENGAVELYYDGSKKFETYNGGCQMGGDLSFSDSQVANFGTGSDLQVYHDGSNSYLKAVSGGTGNLYVFADGKTIYLRPKSGEDGIKVIPDESVELYENGTKVAETTSGGWNVEGITYSNGLDMDDNHKILLGTGDDLEIYHDGSNSFIKNSTGGLDLNSDTIHLRNGANSETYARFLADGAAELYYDNALQVKTTSTGITLGDSKRVDFGDGSDLQIYHTGNSIIQNTNGAVNLVLQSDYMTFRANHANEDYIKCIKDGAVDLYYDNNKRLETTSYGISVPGEIRDDRGNIRDIQSEPLSGTHSSRTLVAADAGKVVVMSGNLTLPSATGGGPFGGGSTITILNKSGSAITLTQGTGLTLYNTADATTGNRTLAGRGIATVYYMYGGNEAYISGAGLS